MPEAAEELVQSVFMDRAEGGMGATFSDEQGTCAYWRSVLT